MEISKEHLDRLEYQLERIANAVEVLAVTANSDFMPMGDYARQFRKDLRDRSKRQPHQPAQEKP
jgi:hypothetical protein